MINVNYIIQWRGLSSVFWINHLNQGDEILNKEHGIKLCRFYRETDAKNNGSLEFRLIEKTYIEKIID